jgi:membrane protein DedA with SNARE-associated domain
MSPKAKAATLIALALLIPIVPFAIIGELPGERWLSAADDNAVLFGLTGGGLLAIDVLLPIPSSIVGTLLGARLGFLPGLLWCWAGLMIGNLVGYATGRLLLARFGERLPQAPTLVALFLSRPVPVFAEAVTFTAGAERMPLRHFIAVCAAGNLLYASALAGNGAALLPDALAGPGLILPMFLPVMAWVLWRRATAR